MGRTFSKYVLNDKYVLNGVVIGTLLLTSRARRTGLCGKSVWGLALLFLLSSHESQFSSSSNLSHYFHFPESIIVSLEPKPAPSLMWISTVLSPHSSFWCDTLKPKNLGLMPGPRTYYWTHSQMEIQGVNIHRAGKRLNWTSQDIWDLTRKRNQEFRISSLLWAMLSLCVSELLSLGIWSQ